MQNLHDAPPGEDKEPEATTDTELPSTEDIQPLPVQKPPQESNIRQLIREECCVEVPEQQKQKMEDTMLELLEEIDIVTETEDVLPLSVENDDDDYDLLLGEADLFLFNDSIPPGIENVADDPEGDICFLEELLIDNCILSHESFDSSFEDNPSIPRPPPEPPDAETDVGDEIQVVMIGKDKFDDDS
nr:hypothetical protein [Tanacetum cinerariifolium]